MLKLSHQLTEPTDWNAMLKALDVEKWLATAKLKFDAMVKMGFLEVVDIARGLDVPLLGVRWMYEIKRIQTVYERHETRLVVKGYMQEKEIHYNESFSPTISQVTLRRVMA